MPRAKKSLGQNFLIDSNVIDQIIQYVKPDHKDVFLEIGPGKGAISEILIDKSNQVQAVELDDDLLKKLVILEDRGNFRVHKGSILEFNPKKIFDEKIRVIGNLPYNISTPILLWSFKFLDMFTDMHFMFQKEFGDRLFAKNNSKDYGRTSVITQYLTKPKYCFDIDPESFWPKPKVKSVFVKFEPVLGRSFDDPIAQMIQKVTRITFQHRRKMIGKSLENLLSKEKLEALDIDLKLRPENLSVQEYIKISESLI